MNFELIDNFFQVTVLFAAVVADLICWHIKKSREYIILALAHSCFCMGTLYFVLHLFIRGQIPQIFYVAEISWISCYLFFHAFQMFRRRGDRLGVAPVPFACAVIAILIAGRSQIFGPAFLSTGAFALTIGAIMYVALYQLLREKKRNRTDICLLVIVVLQLTLYISSYFIKDFTKFSIYYVIDFVLTSTIAILLPCMLADEKRGEEV